MTLPSCRNHGGKVAGENRLSVFGHVFQPVKKTGRIVVPLRRSRCRSHSKEIARCSLQHVIPRSVHVELTPAGPFRDQCANTGMRLVVRSEKESPLLLSWKDALEVLSGSLQTDPETTLEQKLVLRGCCRTPYTGGCALST